MTTRSHVQALRVSRVRLRLVVNLGPRKRGTAVLVRRGLKFTNLLIEPEGRLISLDVNGITYVGLYAPSGCSARVERKKFFNKTVPTYVLSSKNSAIIVLGDLN